MALGILKWILNKVSRIEIIMFDHGRMYQVLDVKDVEMHLQDDGRTIKLFMKRDKDSDVSAEMAEGLSKSLERLHVDPTYEEILKRVNRDFE